LLTSLKLTLQTTRSARLPPYLGRAARAVLLKLIAEDDAELAEQLHAPNQRRPYTCSRVWGAPTEGGSLVVEPDNEVSLRYTGLTPDVSAQLRRLEAEPPASIELEGVGFRVRQATLDGDQDPWAGRTTYEALSEDR
jgi:hypothetical protein